MSSFITQCPHCRTSFRVSATQLAAAHGAVRCGACLEVFSAARHLLPDDHGPKQVTAAQPQTAIAQAPTAVESSAAMSQEADDSSWLDDDLDLDSLNLDEELAKLEYADPEQPADGVLETTPPTVSPVAAQPQDAIPPLAEQSVDSNEDSIPDRPVTPELTSRPTSSAVFTPVTVDTLRPDPLAAPAHRARDAATQRDPAARIEPELGSTDPMDEPETLSPPIEIASHIDSPARADEPTERDNVLFELEDEPLQLDWQERRTPWARWFGWGALCVIALLALVGQYAAYNFDELARQDRYRPWFEKICPTLGCTVPSRVDISLIKSSNMVVRSHPEFNGALVVDAIIYNRASFAQPFPLLEIRFADINDKPIASRSFKPGEYLAGELAGQTEMPPQVPIHVALEILDPGPTAVNYSLGFRSPE